MIVSFGKKKKSKTSSKSKKTVSAKKLYTIKRSKTGRKSVVQVVTRGKGRVYASTGKRVPSSKKCYVKKSDATKALKFLKTSSFGKKATRRRRTKKIKNEGFVACVNPESDSIRNLYKVYKAYKHRYEGTTYILFKTGSGDDVRYFTLNEDSAAKFRRDKKRANEDKTKYIRLNSANVQEFLSASPCNEAFAAAMTGGFMGGGGGGSGGSFASLNMRLGGAYASVSRAVKDAKEQQYVRGSTARVKVPSPKQLLSGIMDSKVLRDLNSYSSSQLSKTSSALDKAFGGKNGIHPAISGNTKMLGGNFTSIRDPMNPHPSGRGSAHESGLERADNLFKNVNSFGRSRFGSDFPTYGKYAYPVDPQFLRSMQSFGASRCRSRDCSSDFGSRFGGNRFGGNRFGSGHMSGGNQSGSRVVNYGFSRYF